MVDVDDVLFLETEFLEELELSVSVNCSGGAASSLPSTPPEKILRQSSSCSSILEVIEEESDEENVGNDELEVINEVACRQLALTAWLIGQAERSPAAAKDIVCVLFREKIERLLDLGRKLKEEPNYLYFVGISKIDGEAIVKALNKRRRKKIKERKARKSLVSVTSSSSGQYYLQGEKCMVKLRKLLDDFEDEVRSLPRAMDVLCDIGNLLNEFMTSTEGHGDELQISLGKNGICDLVSSVISMFLNSSERLLQSAFRVVCLLCCRKLDDPEAYIEDNIRLFGITDVVKVNVVSAMLKYEDSLLVIKWTMRAVRILSSNDENRVKFGSCGVCHALLHVGKRYAETNPNETITMWVLEAAKCVCVGNIENVSSFVHHGICDFIKSIMIRFVLVESIVISSCVMIQLILKACDHQLDGVLEDDTSNGEYNGVRSKFLQLNICEVLSDCLVMYRTKSSHHLESEKNDAPANNEIILNSSNTLYSVNGCGVFIDVCRALILLLPASSTYTSANISNDIASRLCQDRGIFRALMSPFLEGIGLDSQIFSIHKQLALLWCMKAANALCINIVICEKILGSGVFDALSRVLAIPTSGSSAHLPIVKSALSLSVTIFSFPVETSKLLKSLHQSGFLESVISIICRYELFKGGQFSPMLYDVRFAELVYQALRRVLTVNLIENCTIDKLQNESTEISVIALINEMNKKAVSMKAISALISAMWTHVRYGKKVGSKICQNEHHRVVVNAVACLCVLLESGNIVEPNCNDSSHPKFPEFSLQDCGVIVESLRFLVDRLINFSLELLSHCSIVPGDDVRELFIGVACALRCVNCMSVILHDPTKLLQECLGTLRVGEVVAQVLRFVKRLNRELMLVESKFDVEGKICRELLRHACRTVILISKTDVKLGLRLGEEGACTGLLHILNHYHNDEVLCEDASVALAVLTSSARSIALHTAVVETEKKLDKQDSNVMLQLPRLNDPTPCDLQDNVSHLIRTNPVDTFDVLVRCFGFHVVHNERIASVGCQLFGNIFEYMKKLKTERDSPTYDIANIQTANATIDVKLSDTLSKTLFNILIMALGSHLKCEDVQRDCIFAVNELYELNEYSLTCSGVLAQLNYPGILLNTLRDHKRNAVIVALSMEALIKLFGVSLNSDIDRDFVLRLGKEQCSAVINSLIFWVKDTEVVNRGCRLIYDIACNNKLRQLLHDCKAPYALLLILQTYSSPIAQSFSNPMATYHVMKYALMATLALSHLDSNLYAFDILERQTSTGREADEQLSICKITASVLLAFRSHSEIVTLVLELIMLLGQLSKSRHSTIKKGIDKRIPKAILVSSNANLLETSSLQIPIESTPPHTSFVFRSQLIKVQIHVLIQDMMEFHVADVPILTLGCECLGMLASDDVGSKAIGEDEEVCEVVCNILRASIEREQYLEAVVSRCIGNIARYPVNSLILAENGVCELLVTSLRAYHTTSASHVKEVCLCLAYLCRFNLSNKISLASAGACKLVHECFIQYISNEIVIPAVMFAIVALCHHNKYNLNQFSALGVTDFIVEVYITSDLASQRKDSMIAMILWFIGHIPPANAEMLSSPEVCRFALTNMYMKSDAATVSYGCKALASLACSPSEQNKRALLELQAIEILQELTTVSFSLNVDVLVNSLLAMAALLNSSIHFHHKVEVVGVVTVMENNYVDKRVIEAALISLLSIFRSDISGAHVEGNGKVICSPVSVKIVMDCVRQHITSHDVTRMGCELVSQLCSKFKHVYKEFVEFGACNLIVDSFKVHKRYLCVLSAACSAAIVICRQSSASVNTLCELGLMSTIPFLLRNFATKVSLVCSACEMIATMVRPHSSIWGGSSTLVQASLDGGLALVIVEILQMYAASGCEKAGSPDGVSIKQSPMADQSNMNGNGSPSDQRGSLTKTNSEKFSKDNHDHILHFAVESAGFLAGMDPQLCQELTDAGICECILLLLIKCWDSAVILSATLTTIQQLAKYSDTRQRLMNIDTLAYIEQALKNHAEDKGTSENETLLRIAKKSKAVLEGQSFLRRSIGMGL